MMNNTDRQMIAAAAFEALDEEETDDGKISSIEIRRCGETRGEENEWEAGTVADDVAMRLVHSREGPRELNGVSVKDFRL